MEWIRHHPRTSAIIAGVVTLVCLVLVWSLISPKSEDQSADALGVPAQPSLTPLTDLPSPTASPTATATPGSGIPKGAGAGFAGFANGGIQGGSTMNLPGLQGGSYYKYLPKHRLELSVTSEAPIGVVGYVIPTSLRTPTGVAKKVGTSWHLSTTVYGSPDYAQLFMQAGARGYPITCTIKVDGKVTERRSTDGPYGQLVCQG
ncbi:hypothetical protein [Marmoricola sp. RAF53]|uniref:hypothetical protein n=1 Tax=Marmoricola sp. RAF53 TaxID=3233059 RepID=UPI003F97416E